jgi:hypothetical protein
MHDPERVADLHRIYNTESIATMGEGNLEDARTQTPHRFGNVGFAAFGRDTKGGFAFFLGLSREVQEILQRGFQP